MKVLLARPTLDAVDGTHSDSTCVFVFEDIRPLMGLASLVDWRIGAFLSGLVQQGWFTGAAGEKLLIPVKHKLPVNKLFCFGLGPSSGFSRGVQQETLSWAFDVIRQAGAHGTILTAPGRAEGFGQDMESLETLCTLLDPRWDFDEVVVVDEFRRLQEATRKLALWMEPLRAGS